MTVSLDALTNTLTNTLSSDTDWLKHSQSDLYAAIARIRFVLEKKIAAKKDEPLEERVEPTTQKQQVDSYLNKQCKALVFQHLKEIFCCYV
jgi:hypothetical protein